MRTAIRYAETATLPDGTSLTSLVDQLLRDAAPLARQSKSIFVNEIEPAFFTSASSSLIQPVVEGIIHALLNAAKHGNIHIYAEKFRDSITLEFEERNNYNGYALTFRLCSLEPLAREAGGYLSVKGEKALLARISFCFPDTGNIGEFE